MRWSWFGAVLLGFYSCTQLSRANEQAPGCTYEGMRQRVAELIEPCTAVLANTELSNETRAAALFVRGRAYHNLMWLEPALQDYNDALELTSDDDQILASRADVFMRLGEKELQLQDLKKALEINPYNTAVMISFGEVYSHSGHSMKAILYFSRAIELDPNNTFAFIFRKDAFVRRGDLPNALLDANDAVRAAQLPDQPNYFEGGVARNIHVAALIERAILLQTMGERERAEQDFYSAVEKDRSSYALIKRAQYMKRPSAADIADLQEAIRREPSNTKAIYTLGLRLMNEQQFAAALIVFGRSIEIDPYDGYSLRMRALLHRGSGRTEEAMRDLMRAIYADRRILAETMQQLHMAGYWHATQAPDGMTPQLEDALRACMVDIRC